MSLYLELPEWPTDIPFRTFSNSGHIIVFPHWHKEIEVIYVTKGSVNIGYNEQLYQVQEGEIFFFESGVSHYFLASPESERLVFQFDLKLFKEDASYGLSQKSLIEVFDKAENLSRNWPQEVEKKIETCLLHAYQEFEDEKIGYKYAIIAALNEMLTYFLREVPQKAETTRKEVASSAMKNKATLERMNEVFQYIESNYRESFTLEEVAKAVGFSSAYFTRFFKKNTGVTFMQFLTEYRINQAKYILGSEKVPMIEVAERSGFSSVKTFHHIFKNEVGISPLKYQKSISGNN